MLKNGPFHFGHRFRSLFFSDAQRFGQPKLFIFNPIHALTFHAEVTEGVADDAGCPVYIVEDAPYLPDTGNYLDRWTVHRILGIFCWAVYGYA